MPTRKETNKNCLLNIECTMNLNFKFAKVKKIVKLKMIYGTQTLKN